MAAGVLLLALTSHGTPPDPSAAGNGLSSGAALVDSAILVLREGLEAILVLAAVTASFRTGNVSLRRPIAAGATAAIGLTVVTWFVAIAAIGALGGPGLDVQAGTGLLAVVVLLLVMNWFFHNVYWTGWIGQHTARRKRIVAGLGSDSASRTWLGLAALGFTAVYREGFEIVLFLQNLRLTHGNGVVLGGVAIGLTATAVVGVITFGLQARLPYRRLLVTTGALLGVVLLVMVGESAQELQLAGWLPTHAIDLSIPAWAGLWFAVFPTVESLAAQALAATVVIGSYVVSHQVKIARPRARAALQRGPAAG